MTKKRANDALIRKHVWLDANDCDRIESLFGETIGFSEAIRLMLRKFLDGIEAKAQGAAKALPHKPVEVDLP